MVGCGAAETFNLQLLMFMTAWGQKKEVEVVQPDLIQQVSLPWVEGATQQNVLQEESLIYYHWDANQGMKTLESGILIVAIFV